MSSPPPSALKYLSSNASFSVCGLKNRVEYSSYFLTILSTAS